MLLVFVLDKQPARDESNLASQRQHTRMQGQQTFLEVKSDCE